MQLFAKTKSRDAGGDFKPWHPNFRNTSELPDTKTVRTRFFVNAGAVTFAICGLLFLAYNEYLRVDATGRRDQFEAQAQVDRKASADAVALYKTFKGEEEKANLYVEFVSGSKLLYSDFLLELGAALPPNIVITSINYTPRDVSLRGEVQGAPQEASGIASDYERQLRESPSIASRFESIALANLARDQNSGSLNFEMIMKFAANKAAK